METTPSGGVTPPARVAMETTKLLVGGGVEPVTSSAGASKDYGGAQQLNAAEQENAGTCCQSSTGRLGTVLDQGLLFSLILDCCVIVSIQADTCMASLLSQLFRKLFVLWIVVAIEYRLC